MLREHGITTRVLGNDSNNVVVGSRTEKNYFESNLDDKSGNRNFSNSIGHNSQSDNSTIANGESVLISEKKIEIAAYYHKEIPTVETEIQVRSEETCPEVPPPLPLTGPPKLEQLNLQSKNIDQSSKKFSMSVDPWRQDDKSERSVRDKIAMFSSQSSLDSPLFPNSVNVPNVTNVRKLSKYKSSEDVCSDEKSPNHKERCSFFSDRTQSSFDLTDSVKSYSPEGSPCKRYPNSCNKMLPPPPPVPQKPTIITTTPMDTKNYLPSLPMKSYSPSNAITSPDNMQSSTKLYSSMLNSPIISPNSKVTSTPILTRATSFSGSSSFTQERSTSGNNDASNGNNQVSRTNSLASTFRRNSEDMRRTSLNQLIEQRRRSISKLRGLVIPEKETLPIEQPIVDLPEIKSRNSILLSQLPKANIQDKWGSQSSIASNTSSASVPLKATSFKMPAPQINSKYSPAFKRKSLTVYGSSGNTINSSAYMTKNIQGNNASSNTSNNLSEPPKSLESICSPTRSDYSFEFVSTSNSPDVLRGRPRTNTQRKTRNDYDDSDNDSAVSSSQSSISRGFSPPMSPVPSERSTVSSERSYVSNELNYQRRSFIIDTSNKAFVKSDNESIINAEQFHARTNIHNNERTYVSSERSSSSSSSSSSSNPRSPQPVDTTRSSQIPQRQALRRSNSTETNCSTSSTLTSGSQASAESLSRRVLKPQSVEAINRKNILASARCRSGRDLNGSPLIQRKFSDEEETHAENGGTIRRKNNVSNNNGVPKQDIKIAYIEVTDSFLEEDDQLQRKIEEPKLPPKRTIITPAVRPPKSEMLEPSNDLKMWVRAEAKALARSSEEKLVNTIEKGSSVALKNQTTSRGTNEQYNTNDLGSKKRSVQKETEQISQETMKQRCKVSTPIKKTQEDQNDLLTILTTRSRSRSAIHVDDGSFGRSKSQMSLEDILSAKVETPCPKLLRTQSIEGRTENGSSLSSHRPSPESRDNNRLIKKTPTNSNDSWRDDKPFVSKIPTLGRSRILDKNDDTEIIEKSKNNTSKILTGRNLGRRSVSVTDMKKALDKIDATTNGQNQQVTPTSSHNRFPSLDSSIDDNVSSIENETDNERFCSEQFGSISSLASSTSLISQQELAQLVEEASLEEARCAHEVIVVLLHKENPTGSVGITLAGGADCEVKEITVHRVLAHSIADKDGRVQRGDRILSINGRSARGLTHRESLTVLKQPRSEVVLVVSRARIEEGCKLRSRTASVETIVEGFEMNAVEDTAWGPPSMVAVYKDGAGLGFSLEGGRDSPLGDRPLVIKKIFTGGAAEKTGALKAGDQLLEVNGSDVTRMSRIEAWSLMKKLHDGEVNLLVRHPATKSS
ncbi:hypothetical protein M0802_007600 [Mischocyttarus mexicanus]|nr:hypothetical protein M0802_007600 [Mischocyttarus mexicanus]